MAQKSSDAKEICTVLEQMYKKEEFYVQLPNVPLLFINPFSKAGLEELENKNVHAVISSHVRQICTGAAPRNVLISGFAGSGKSAMFRSYLSAMCQFFAIGGTISTTWNKIFHALFIHERFTQANSANNKTSSRCSIHATVTTAESSDTGYI